MGCGRRSACVVVLVLRLFVPAPVQEAVMSVAFCLPSQSLALLQEGSNQIHLWELASRKLSALETTLRSPTFLCWAKHEPTLAAGDSRGNVLIYSKETRRKIPVMGLHSASVSTGIWRSDGTLCLGAEDETITLSDPQGTIIERIEIDGKPQDMRLSQQKRGGGRRSSITDGTSPPEATLSVNAAGQNILLLDLDEKSQQPIKLAFQGSYGPITAYDWFGDGYIIIGFRGGYVVIVSTHSREVSNELYNGHFFDGSLDDLAFSPQLQRAAVAGNSAVRVLDVQTQQELMEDQTDLEPSYGVVDRIQWTSDGQILTVSTMGGHLLTFLASMPIVHKSQGSRIAFLSSLREMTVMDTMANDASVRLPLRIEPSQIGLGPHHAAVSMNNRAWFHRLVGDAGPFEREYVAVVDDLVVGDHFAAAQADGKAFLHPIEPVAGRGDDVESFPKRAGGPAITAIAISSDFLFLGSAAGTVDVYHLRSGTMLEGSRFVHPLGDGVAGAGGETQLSILKLFPNHAGTRLVVVDASNRLYFFNPVDGLRLPVPQAPERIQTVLWDPADWGLFLVSNGASLASYLHTAHSVNGPLLTHLGNVRIAEDGAVEIDPTTTPLPRGTDAMVVYNGSVVCQGHGGRIQRVPCMTHKFLTKGARSSAQQLRESFGHALQLSRLRDAWNAALLLNERHMFLALANKAMELLHPDVATRVYRHLGDAGMVVALENVADIEDSNLLAGHMATLFADYARAQELFLDSSDPRAALQLRMDLLEWDQALRLAQSLAPNEVPRISMEIAKQHELRGDNTTALQAYQRAQAQLPPFPADFSRSQETRSGDTEDVEGDGWLVGAPLAALHRTADAGLARTSLRTGDVRRGLRLAREGPPSLAKECAVILEDLRQYKDAAELFQRAGAWEKAAGLLIRSKAFEAVAPLMEHVSSPTLLIAFAKAQEQAGNYHGAVEAYERGRDHDGVVRVLVDHLHDPERAGEIVRRTRSVQAARKLSAHCREAGNTRGAIEFLLIARQTEEAFEMAREHDEMELYINVLASNGEVPVEEYLRVGNFFEGRQQWGEAGKYFARAGQYHKALRLFMQCGEEHLDDAIEVVGRASNDALTHSLIDFLMGETDGVPKDPNYVFKLYMALGNYVQAARTSVIIARQEQELGNNRVAHRILFETHRDLVQRDIRIPTELDRHLELLHSYLIVKRLVKENDHPTAARMLIRVCAQLSKFPSQEVPILTSAVIECQRAGLKRTSFEYATMLMRPEYRSKIEEKLRRKIENLVRRPSQEERDEELAPCPSCRYSLPVTTLSCPSCRSHLPYCVVTGKHMTLDDWSECPHCRWPALYSALRRLQQSPGDQGSACPMCEQTIHAGTVQRSRDPVSDFHRWMALGKDKSRAKTDAAATEEEAKEEEQGTAGERGQGGSPTSNASGASRPSGPSGAAAAAAAAMGL